MPIFFLANAFIQFVDSFEIKSRFSITTRRIISPFLALFEILSIFISCSAKHVFHSPKLILGVFSDVFRRSSKYLYTQKKNFNRLIYWVYESLRVMNNNKSIDLKMFFP